MGSGRRGDLVRATLGLAISVVALALVYRSVDIGGGLGDAQDARSRGGSHCCSCSSSLDVLLRAVRWRVLLAAAREGLVHARRRPRCSSATSPTTSCPARLGEVVRAHDLGGRTGLSRSAILGTIVVERVVDTMVVVAIASVAILVLSVRGVVASAVLVGLAVTALLAVGVAAGIAAHRLPGAARVSAFLGQWPRVHGALVRLREGLSRRRATPGRSSPRSSSRSPRGRARCSRSPRRPRRSGVEPTMAQAALLAAGTNLATAIPAGPGYVGHVRAGRDHDRDLRRHRPRLGVRLRAPRPRGDAPRDVGRRRRRCSSSGAGGARAGDDDAAVPPLRVTVALATKEAGAAA